MISSESENEERDIKLVKKLSTLSTKKHWKKSKRDVRPAITEGAYKNIRLGREVKNEEEEEEGFRTREGNLKLKEYRKQIKNRKGRGARLRNNLKRSKEYTVKLVERKNKNKIRVRGAGSEQLKRGGPYEKICDYGMDSYTLECLPSGQLVFADVTRIQAQRLMARAWFMAISRNKRIAPHWELSLPEEVKKNHEKLLEALLRSVEGEFDRVDGTVTSVTLNHGVGLIYMRNDVVDQDNHCFYLCYETLVHKYCIPGLIPELYQFCLYTPGDLERGVEICHVYIAKSCPGLLCETITCKNHSMEGYKGYHVRGCNGSFEL